MKTGDAHEPHCDPDSIKYGIGTGIATLTANITQTSSISKPNDGLLVRSFAGATWALVTGLGLFIYSLI